MVEARWLVAVVPNTHTHKKRTHIFYTRATGCKVLGQLGELPAQFSKPTRWEVFFIFAYNKALRSSNILEAYFQVLIFYDPINF